MKRFIKWAARRDYNRIDVLGLLTTTLVFVHFGLVPGILNAAGFAVISTFAEKK